MKTDVNVDETVKIERRKLFWRLYALPWIISVILLSLISSGFIWAIVDISKSNSVRDEGILQRGISNGRKEIQQEAIDNFFGIWSVDRYGLVEFIWTSNWSSNVIDGLVDQKSFTGCDIVPKAEMALEREYSYSLSDHEFGKGIGINLEEDLVRAILFEVRKSFTEYISNVIAIEDLEIVLKDRLELSIRHGFDGFETYHKMK